MRSTTMTPQQIEANGRWLLPALESIAVSGTASGPDAERHAQRMRFALGRVADLQQRLAARASALDEGRLQVAQSILATHYQRASAFVSAITAPSAPPLGERLVRQQAARAEASRRARAAATVADSDGDDDAVIIRERAAA